MEIDKNQIGLIIQTARKNAGLKQSELAERIGISEKHLSKIETGKYYPALDTFLRILDVLNLTLGDFGFVNVSDSSQNKEFILKIVNSSSDKQLQVYADMISAVMKYI